MKYGDLISLDVNVHSRIYSVYYMKSRSNDLQSCQVKTFFFHQFVITLIFVG